MGAATRRFGTTWPYLLPALFFFVGWQLYPVVRVLYISFTDYHFLTGGPTHWVWFRNYTDAFSDPLVRKGLLRALIFTAIFLPGMVFFPMVLAVLVDRVRSQKAASTYRLILLIPAMIPGPLIFVLWGWLYSSAIGPINYFLVDVFHVYKGGSSFMGLRLLSGSALHVIHMNDYPANPPRSEIKDAQRVYPGDGVAPLGSMLRDLFATGFSGTLSLELFNRAYWEQDALNVARTGLEKMKEVVGKAVA